MLWALGVSNPWMLLWLPAAAIPLIIHLLGKRRRITIPWAATHLLQAAVRQNSHRKRIHHWMLLLIRTLLIISIVFCAAEPFLESESLATAVRRPEHLILVFDVSYSMGYRSDGTLVLDTAKSVARDLLAKTADGDVVTVVSMGRYAKSAVTGAVQSQESLLEIVEALPLEQTTASLPPAIDAVAKAIKSVDGEHFRVSRHKAFFLSDLSTRTWDVPEFSALERLAEVCELFAVDVGADEWGNVAVIKLDIADELALTNRPVEIHARLKHFGSRTFLDGRVELIADGQRVQAVQADIDSEEDRVFAFQHRFTAPGQHVIEARYQGDDLDSDNHFFYVLPVRDSIRVLCIEGGPLHGGQPGEADFLALALEGEESAAEVRDVRVQIVSDGKLNSLDLTAYDCIMFCNVARISPEESALVKSFVSRGGALVLFLGDRIVPESYHGAWHDNALADEQLLPAQIVGLSPVDVYQFDPLNYEHALLEAFRGQASGGLLTTPVFRYWRVEPAADSAARMALAFSSGDPAIVEKKFGQGRVILVTMPASTASRDSETGTPWTLLTAWPSFPPLIHELLAFSIRHDQAELLRHVGEPILIDPIPGRLPGSLRVQLPSGEIGRVETSTGGSPKPFVFADTWQSGIYRCLAGEESSVLSQYAVNVDTQEGNFQRTRQDGLPSAFTLIDASLIEMKLPGQTTTRFNPRDLLLALAGLLLCGDILLSLMWWRAR